MKLVAGQDSTGSMMVRRAEIKKAKNGNLYVSGEVFDKDGVHPLMSWNHDLVRRQPQAGDVVEGVFRATEFNGKLQLEVTELFALTKAANVEDMSNFVRQSHVTKEKWLAYYNAEVRPLLDHKGIEKLIDDAIASEPGFFTCPAAKTMHQNWRGGLAEHTHRILRLFVSLTNSGHPSFSSVCRALIVAGIVLHDAGKALEYEEIAPGQYEIGKWGTLVGHLAGGPIHLSAMVATGEYEIEYEMFLHLMHVLLSHHGQVDWGSPVVPATREAVVVHMLDNLDGKLSMMEEAPEGQLVRGIGARIWSTSPQTSR